MKVKKTSKLVRIGVAVGALALVVTAAYLLGANRGDSASALPGEISLGSTSTLASGTPATTVSGPITSEAPARTQGSTVAGSSSWGAASTTSRAYSNMGPSTMIQGPATTTQSTVTGGTYPMMGTQTTTGTTPTTVGPATTETHPMTGSSDMMGRSTASGGYPMMGSGR
jgi:hypothetical protein